MKYSRYPNIRQQERAKGMGGREKNREGKERRKEERGREGEGRRGEKR